MVAVSHVSVWTGEEVGGEDGEVCIDWKDAVRDEVVGMIV